MLEFVRYTNFVIIKIIIFCPDQLIRMDARRNDPTVNSEDLARDKLAIKTKSEKLKQDNTKRRDVSRF